MIYKMTCDIVFDCGCKHEFVKKTRRLGNSGCPYCTSKKMCCKKQSFKYKCENSKLWNYELNGKLRPERLFPNSSKRVWWKCINNKLKCNCSHFWKTTITRINNGVNCPYCSNEKICCEKYSLKNLLHETGLID